MRGIGIVGTCTDDMARKSAVSGVGRLVEILGYESLSAMCRGIGLERTDVYRALRGDGHALRRVTNKLGPDAAKIAFAASEASR